MIHRLHWSRISSLLPLICLAALNPARADVLVGVNGERFVGKIVRESADIVVFESETAGRLTVPRTRIRELQKTTPAETSGTNTVLAVTNAAGINASNWVPPGVGTDGSDWLQLKSSEWLKGHLSYVQDKKVLFESDELEDLSLKLKDVRQLYSGKAMFAKFHGRDQVYGTIVLSNDLVDVVGPEQLELPRAWLTGITPGGESELDFWCLKFSFGLNVQEGNTRQVTLNSAAELSRRTPATQVLVNYLCNFSDVNGQQNANNHRVNFSYDVRLNRDWFLRPVQLEYYRDQLANIAHRVTAGVGVGYYLFDRDGLEWVVAAGPSYQYNRFYTVAPGEADTASTPAGTLQTRFEADITKRLTFIQTYAGTFTSQDAGLYTHHTVSTFEFEIKRRLELDLSFVWDYLQSPQAEANGNVPLKSDFRLSLGIGCKF